MPDLPSAPAIRLTRARWLDTRLVVGLLLMAVSVALGVRVVGAADYRVPVWAVVADLGPGSTLTEADLVRRDVRLDGNVGRYVRGDASPPVDYVLTRAVGRDELLPVDAVASRRDARLRRLAVEVERVSTAGLPDRAVVDVYVVPEQPLGARTAGAVRSRPVLTGVTVDAVQRGGGGFASAGGGRAEGVVLLVEPAEAQKVLDAQAEGSLRLLQVPSSARQVTEAGS